MLLLLVAVTTLNFLFCTAPRKLYPSKMALAAILSIGLLPVSALGPPLIVARAPVFHRSATPVHLCVEVRLL